MAIFCCYIPNWLLCIMTRRYTSEPVRNLTTENSHPCHPFENTSSMDGYFLLLGSELAPMYMTRRYTSEPVRNLTAENSHPCHPFENTSSMDGYFLLLHSELAPVYNDSSLYIGASSEPNNRK